MFSNFSFVCFVLYYFVVMSFRFRHDAKKVDFLYKEGENTIGPVNKYSK